MESLKVMLVPLLVIFGVSVLVLIVSAMRNRVMFKMGARNVPRRMANTVLTCLGLMLAAMIFSASFATGDTLTHSIRNLAVDHLGKVDIMIMQEGVEFGGMGGAHSMGSVERTGYFSQEEFEKVKDSLADSNARDLFDGITPVIIEIVPVVAHDLNEPRVTLLGLDAGQREGFEPLIDEEGLILLVEDLAEGQVYINSSLAEALEVDLGGGVDDEIKMYLSPEGESLTVAGVYEEGGNPSAFDFDSGASMVMALPQLKSLRGSDDINYILISNKGGAINGSKHSDAVMEALDLEGTDLKAESIKKDALDAADEGGATFSTMFLVMGSFSMIAGVLLIFLIFVMLAAERKQELGIARAIGTQRSHIVWLFTFEGVLYALIASAVGSGLGLLISWGGMTALDSAFKEMGFRIVFDYTLSGVVISYLAGVVFTLIVVVISAWRVSNLNIICAIKDIPEPKHEGRRNIKGLLVVIVFPILGILMIVTGIQHTQWAPYSLGVSLVIIGLCMLARKRPFRLPDRPAFTAAGIGLMIFWLSPSDWHPRGEEMGAGFEMFILTGVMLVAGAVWVVMYNSDLLLGAIMAIFGRLRVITPMIKTAVSYPMASRFRTGMAVAMFALIIFTLVYMSSMIASIQGLLDDTERVTGGFDIRAEVNYNNPITDMEAALMHTDGVSNDDFEAIGAFSVVFASMRDASGTPDENIPGEEEAQEEEWTDLFLTGMDAGYTENVTYDFEIMAEGYTSKEQIWQAMTDDPSLVLVSSALVPTKYSQMGGGEIDLIIGEGEFVIEDDIMPDNIFIEVQHPFTKQVQKLQVIGVFDVMAGPYAGLVSTSQQTVENFWGATVAPTAYRFKVKPDRVDAIPEIARNLEKGFVENGVNAEVMEEEVKDYMKIQEMFFNLMMAFMGLGLIVGIAALGVIAARSVVERRQQIGMLRAIGFQQGMIQFSFLLESSFVALLGIGLGVALGAGTAYLFMGEADIEGIKAIIPWGRVGFIVGIAYFASLLTTFIPAYRAARIYPAEALRYE
jgi:putative ABC transport system permease protein